MIIGLAVVASAGGAFTQALVATVVAIPDLGTFVRITVQGMGFGSASTTLIVPVHHHVHH